MKKIITLLCICLATQVFGQVLNETFDSNAGFTTSDAFFSDGFSDYFGLAVVDDYNGDAVPANLKAYTGFSGGFLAGMDLDGEGATIPITVDWTGLDITGLSSLMFSGEFAEFFDSPGDIDGTDFILVEFQIDGGGYQNLLAFEANGDQVNEVFAEDTNFDGFGDGTILTNAAQAFSKSITGSGTTLDLRLTLRVNSGDEDFAVDTFVITGTPATGNPPMITCPSDVVTPASSGLCEAVVTFPNAIATDPDGDLDTVEQTGGLPSGSAFPVGDNVVTFTATDLAGNSVSCSFTITVEDTEDPIAVCQDITVQLDANGMYTLNASEIDGGSSDNCGNVNLGFGSGVATNLDGLYILVPGFQGAPNNLARYDYDPVTDAITLVDNPYGDTGIGNSIHFDFNPADGQVYLLGVSPTTGNRALFLYDLENNILGAELGDVVSSTGATNPNSIVFSNDGTLYVSFGNGNINTLDLGTMTTTAFSTPPFDGGGGIGLAYNYDNDTVIYSTNNNTTGDIDLYEIDATGNASSLFSFTSPCGSFNGTAQALEYLGNGKLISGSTFNCDTIITIDIVGNTTNVILTPDGFEGEIKSMIYAE
nr:HYR domain-containing protein [Flavobacteriaceae bacterium]